MADYTYEKLNEQIKTDESLMEEYGKYSDPVSRDVYSQAKNRLAENQPLLAEYATAYKEKQQQTTYKQNVEAFDKQFNEKIEKLQTQNDMHAEDIQYIDGMVLPNEWSEEQTQQWRNDYRQLKKKFKKRENFVPRPKSVLSLYKTNEEQDFKIVVEVNEIKEKKSKVIKKENKINETRKNDIFSDKYDSMTHFMLSVNDFAKENNIEINFHKIAPIFKAFMEYEDKNIKIIYNESTGIGEVIKK